MGARNALSLEISCMLTLGAGAILAVAAFNPTERISGKTIIRVRPLATRAHRCTRPAGAVQIGRLRPMAPGPWFRKYATPSDPKSIACSVI